MSETTVSNLVYVVDDDVNVRRSICLALKESNFEVHEFVNGIDLIDGVHRRIPDVIILDWILSPMDGLTICGRLKLEKNTSNIPIMMITSKTDEMDCVLALEMGIDDYLKKPLSLKELVARVKALIRRKEINFMDAGKSENEIIEIGNLKINLANRTVSKDSKFLDLTMKEFDLLVNLITEKSKVMTREQLMSRVWAIDFCGDARTVDVHIRYLRQKIEDKPEDPKLVLTVRGLGYRFASMEELQQSELSV